MRLKQVFNNSVSGLKWQIRMVTDEGVEYRIKDMKSAITDQELVELSCIVERVIDACMYETTVTTTIMGREC